MLPTDPKIYDLTKFHNFFPQGVKVKMDDAGNILVRRYAKSNVYIKTPTSNSYMDDAATDIQPNTPLEFEKVYKVRNVASLRNFPPEIK